MTEVYHLTKEGLNRIKEEHERLLELRRKKTLGEEVPSSWHSEEVNPDYLAYQEDMNLLEAKIEEYEAILRNVEMIKPPEKEKRNEVQLGAVIKVEVDKEQDEFTLVGSLEANPMVGKISNESPVGHALIGRRVGEEVVVNSSIQIRYRILHISYE